MRRGDSWLVALARDVTERFGGRCVYDRVHMSSRFPQRAWLARSRGSIVALALTACAAACDAPSALRDLAAAPATAHEQYARGLRDAGLAESALGREWLDASDSAMRAPLEIVLPYLESGFYSRSEARAVAYRITLRGGERLALTLLGEGRPAQLFVDLFEETRDSPGDSLAHFVHRVTGRSSDIADSSVVRSESTAVAPRDSVSIAAELSLVYEAERAGTFVLRFQPELLRDGRYRITIRTDPILAFPVRGGRNRAVQSFFGADRDAGRRVHHGIDIFAARGTPVVAATDGVVRSISPNTLGGNVVWLRDERRGQTLYYAHLDRHAVAAGQVVRTGDVIGFVGNSGNARTTRPHLHFGVYRRGEGPVDPWPWVRLVTADYPRISADTARLGSRGRITAAAVALLWAPSTRGGASQQVTRGTAVRVMGAAGAWYRVQLDDGQAGFLPARQVATQ